MLTCLSDTISSRVRSIVAELSSELGDFTGYGATFNGFGRVVSGTLLLTLINSCVSLHRIAESSFHT